MTLRITTRDSFILDSRNEREQCCAELGLHHTSHIRAKLIKSKDGPHVHMYIKEEREFTLHVCHSSRYRIKTNTSTKGSTKSFPCFIYDLRASSCMQKVNSLLLQHSCFSACTQDFVPAQDSKGHWHSLDNAFQILDGLCNDSSYISISW